MFRKVLFILVSITALSYAQFGVSPSTIKAKVNSITYEEAPFYPAVFFRSGSQNIDARFNPLLSEIAKRLALNVDVVVEVRGYFHPRGDGEDKVSLAMRRAIKVKEAILNLSKNKNLIKDRVVTQPSPDPARMDRGVAGSTDPKIQAENQLAVISTAPMTKFSVDELIKDTYKLVKILEYNPLAFAIVRSQNPGDWREISEKLPPHVVWRVFYFSSFERKVTVHGDWVVRRPWCNVELGGKISADAVNASAKSQLYGFIREDGYPVGVFATPTISFGVIDPRWNYYVVALEESPAGNSWAWSKPIKFKISGKEERTERWFVVNYDLPDIKLSEEPYAIANRFVVARRIIELVDAGFKLDVTVVGHTDVLKDEERSRQQSLYWAKLEMGAIIDIVAICKNVGKIGDWFDEHGVKITAKGEMGNKPATLGGKIFCDNSLPEGRLGNRRVEVVIKATR